MERLECASFWDLLVTEYLFLAVCEARYGYNPYDKNTADSQQEVEHDSKHGPSPPSPSPGPSTKRKHLEDASSPKKPRKSKKHEEVSDYDEAIDGDLTPEPATPRKLKRKGRKAIGREDEEEVGAHLDLLVQPADSLSFAGVPAPSRR